MAELDIKEMLEILVAVVFVVIILVMILRIMLKVRKGSSTKKRKETRVLESIPATSNTDDIFNTITSTRRIASDLKRRGIDTSEADALISEANTYYDQGLENRAKLTIKEAKDLLFTTKKQWDKKTGFGVVSSKPTVETHSPPKEVVDLTGEAKPSTKEGLKTEEEIPDLSKTMEKKPDNYLPSKFTISLAGSAVENARMAGADASEAQRLLIDAKACFDKEDYDEAFKLALCCKREAEGLLGVSSTEGKKVISDLATVPVEEEELKICSICGNRKMAYICIEVNGGEEATCRECYDKSMGKAIQPKIEFPPPPPPPLGEVKEVMEEEKAEEHNYCPNCGAKVKFEDVFCGKCGKPVKEELKCVGCGTKVEPGDMFCRKCGARLVT
jgi:hypothetical protein